MVDRSSVQVSISWAKITHKNRVKRISKPSSDLQTFIGQVKAHFKELEPMNYCYDTDGSKIEDECDKFALQW